MGTSEPRYKIPSSWRRSSAEATRCRSTRMAGVGKNAAKPRANPDLGLISSVPRHLASRGLVSTPRNRPWGPCSFVPALFDSFWERKETLESARPLVACWLRELDLWFLWVQEKPPLNHQTGQKRAELKSSTLKKRTRGFPAEIHWMDNQTWKRENWSAPFQFFGGLQASILRLELQQFDVAVGQGQVHPWLALVHGHQV